MSDPSALLIACADGVARVTMNRPERHNAFDDRLIAELGEAFARLGADPAVRVMVLAGAGKSFSAGADLNWMRRSADYGFDENLDDARGMAGMLHALAALPKPTLALVHGAAIGGGVGLVAACDIALATERASFRLSEVALGLVPAVIGPYVVAAVGARAARRYMLTAERIEAAEALRLGLVHALVPEAEFEAAGARIAKALKGNGPAALAEAKRLVAEIAGRPIGPALVEETAQRIARVRAGDEAKEGIGAFLEKRAPRWRGT